MADQATAEMANMKVEDDPEAAAKKAAKKAKKEAEAAAKKAKLEAKKAKPQARRFYQLSRQCYPAAMKYMRQAWLTLTH